MHEELIERLREEARAWCCNCCYRQGDCICGAPDDRKKDCDVYTKLQAARTIEEMCKALDDAHNELANKTEDKVGHWIEHEDDWWGNYWECSNCHDEYSIIEGDMYYKHCPGCGAKMEYIGDE